MAIRTSFCRSRCLLSAHLLSVSRSIASGAPLSRPTPVHKPLSRCQLPLPRYSPMFPKEKTRYWIVKMETGGVQFDCQKAVLNYCVRILSACAGEKIAKNIYFISVDWDLLRFGVKCDEKTRKKIKESPYVQDVRVDRYHDARNVYPRAQYSPLNFNKRLFNIFSYHCSACSSKQKEKPGLPFPCYNHKLDSIISCHCSTAEEENSSHWLIIVKQPDSRPGPIFHYFIKLLASVVGSKEAAVKRMYAIWCTAPCGFGAKINAGTAYKLRCERNVLKVLPDYVFDIKDQDRGTLVVYRSTEMNFDPTFEHYLPTEEYYSDCEHWFIVMEKPHGDFSSIEESNAYCSQILADAVGSGVGAKNKIYRIETDGDFFGFAAEIEEATSKNLKCMPGVQDVLPDYFFDKGYKLQSAYKFTPALWKHRVEDIFSYHYLSERKSKWDFDHWLVVIKESDGGFGSALQTVGFCIQMLAKFIGREEAKQRIYVVWSKEPYGFGVEVDVEIIAKLKDVPDVLYVLPDYEFDVKDKNFGILVISTEAAKDHGPLLYFNHFDVPDDDDEEED